MTVAKKLESFDARIKREHKAYAARLERDAKELKKKAPKFPVPEGFCTEWRPNLYGNGEDFVMKSDDIELIFRSGGPGTCKFKVGDSWRTFDRIGVDDSFYWKPWDYKGAPKVDLKEVYSELFARITKSREFAKSAIKVPEIGHSVSPERLVTMKAELNKKGFVSFYPSGFGTGYNVTKKSTRKYGVKRATKALEDFFGVTPLFVESFDCD
jgi:hypothetical protein